MKEKMEVPCSPDDERDIIGAVLYDESAFELAGLHADDFYIHRYRWTWLAFEALRALGDHVDENAVRKELEKSGHLEEVTKKEELPFNTTILHVERSASILREKTRRRAMLAEAQQLTVHAYDLKFPIPETTAKFSTWAELGKVDGTSYGIMSAEESRAMEEFMKNGTPLPPGIDPWRDQ